MPDSSQAMLRGSPQNTLRGSSLPQGSLDIFLFPSLPANIAIALEGTHLIKEALGSPPGTKHKDVGSKGHLRAMS